MIRSRCMWLGTAQNQHQTCRFFCCCRIFATVCSFFFLLAVFVGCHAVSLTPLNAYRPMPPKRLLELEGLVGHIALGSEVVEMIPNIPTPMSDASAISPLENWVATVRLRQALFHWNLDAQSLFHERVSRMLVMLGPSVFPVTFGPLLSGHPSTIRHHPSTSWHLWQLWRWKQCARWQCLSRTHLKVLSSSALSICPLVQCPFNSIRSLTSRGHCSFTYMVYTHVTLNIHVYSPTHTDTQWHTLHIDVGVYIHIYI